jgi:hypothetical protein
MVNIHFLALRTQFSCWKFHIESLALACFVESHRLRMSLRQLTFSNTLSNVNSVCLQMQVLAMCTVDEYGKQCGKVTTKVRFKESNIFGTALLKIKF